MFCYLQPKAFSQTLTRNKLFALLLEGPLCYVLYSKHNISIKWEPQLRLQDSEPLGVRSNSLCSKKLLGWFLCMLKFEKHSPIICSQITFSSFTYYPTYPKEYWGLYFSSGGNPTSLGLSITFFAYLTSSLLKIFKLKASGCWWGTPRPKYEKVRVERKTWPCKGTDTGLPNLWLCQEEREGRRQVKKTERKEWKKDLKTDRFTCKIFRHRQLTELFKLLVQIR